MGHFIGKSTSFGVGGKGFFGPAGATPTPPIVTGSAPFLIVLPGGGAGGAPPTWVANINCEGPFALTPPAGFVGAPNIVNGGPDVVIQETSPLVAQNWSGSPTQWQIAASLQALSPFKFYWEILMGGDQSGNDVGFGFSTPDVNINASGQANMVAGATTAFYAQINGPVDVPIPVGATPNVSLNIPLMSAIHTSLFAFALDIPAQKFYWNIGGLGWANAADPAAGTNAPVTWV